MSERVTRTERIELLTGEVLREYEADYTDHGHEIGALRGEARRRMALVPANVATVEQAILIAAFETSAALLECHDTTGISLDEWTGPRELVEDCLLAIGLDGHFLENGV